MRRGRGGGEAVEQGIGMLDGRAEEMGQDDGDWDVSKDGEGTGARGSCLDLVAIWGRMLVAGGLGRGTTTGEECWMGMGLLISVAELSGSVRTSHLDACPGRLWMRRRGRDVSSEAAPEGSEASSNAW